MDNKYNVLFSASFAEMSFNRMATNFLMTFIEDDDQKEMLEKVFKAFNRHGVSTLTVIQAFADVFAEGGLENG